MSLPAPPFPCCPLKYLGARFRGTPAGLSGSADSALDPALRQSRGGPAAAGMAVPGRRTARRRCDQRGDRRPACRADDHRDGRLDRQRHDRHRDDDRRRLGTAPDRGGHRRDRLDRGQPSTQLRGGGDGPALRVPGADERDRRGRRVRADPGGPPTTGLGGRPVRGVEERPRRGPAEQHRDHRRGRARLRQHADQQRVRAAIIGGAAR